LYVDEFQNFATDSFATILSEARKYGLNLTVANQYISQMGDTVRDAVFGNVGTMITFRVSADDAPILSKQFEPQFEATDLLQMHNRHFIINMVINGEKTPAFSATTLTLPQPQIDNTGRIVENTRNTYSRTRAEIEQEISENIRPPAQLQKKPPQSQAQAKQWPPNAQTSKVTHRDTEKPMQAVSVPLHVSSTTPSDNAPKKKRTRSRRRKQPDDSDTSVQLNNKNNQPAQKTEKKSDDNRLQIR